jgi:hypothetical protein
MAVFMDDFHLPPKSLLKAKVKKKNKNLGWEVRYIVLGLTQLLIARDENFHKLLNVVPLSPGTFALKRKGECLIIRTSEREFLFKYDSSKEAELWFLHMLQLTGRELTDFIGETVKIKQHQDFSLEMKEYLDIENTIKHTLIDLNTLKRAKDWMEIDLAGTYEYNEYIKSGKKLDTYKDSILKESVKSIAMVIRILTNRFMRKLWSLSKQR